MQAHILLFLARSYHQLALIWAVRVGKHTDKAAEHCRKAAVCGNLSSESIAKSDEAFADYKLVKRYQLEQKLVDAADQYEARKAALNSAIIAARGKYHDACNDTADKLDALANETL